MGGQTRDGTERKAAERSVEAASNSVPRAADQRAYSLRVERERERVYPHGWKPLGGSDWRAFGKRFFASLRVRVTRVCAPASVKHTHMCVSSRTSSDS